MDVIKNLYHMFLMRNKQNEAVGVCGNKTVNMLAHFAPDCDHCMKHVDATCWMYSAHITFEMYSDLKSFQTSTSF